MADTRSNRRSRVGNDRWAGIETKKKYDNLRDAMVRLSQSGGFIKFNESTGVAVWLDGDKWRPTKNMVFGQQTENTHFGDFHYYMQSGVYARVTGDYR